MKPLVLCLACATGMAWAEPDNIVWRDLRPLGDDVCERAYQQSQSLEICSQPPTDVSYHRCGAQTVNLAGRQVRIAGYARPLAMEFKGVTEFLLTPPLTPCKHPPAPMANQIIRVNSDVPVDMSFDPIFVTGEIVPELSLDGLTQIRYRMRVTRVEPATIPDVQP